MTNVIIDNVEALSHLYDCNFDSFFFRRLQVWGHENWNWNLKILLRRVFDILVGGYFLAHSVYIYM